MTGTSHTWLALVAVIVATLHSPIAVADGEQNVPDAAPAATPAEVAEWLAQLDHDRYLVREKATQNLIEAGPAALDTLLEVANGNRPEPADRAVWILRRQSKSPDNVIAMASLERMVQLKNRPALVEQADMELANRSVRACQEKLSPLGAVITLEPRQFDLVSVVPFLNVVLTEKWRGNPEDLRCLAQLRRQMYFRLEGKAIDDTVVRFFEDKERLAFLQLWETKVTPAGVDAVKARHPDATVYVRGKALLGVQAENHATGVLVSRVEPGTAAFAAGIVAGDIIKSINGHTLPDFDRLTARIAQHAPGETVPVEIIRGGQPKTISVKLGSWAGQEPSP